MYFYIPYVVLLQKSDSLQTEDVSKENREMVLKMEKLADMLTKVTDFALERDKIMPK
jgi:hypothetical protein